MLALAYLWANAVLYVGFAVWCTIAPRRVMDFLGLQNTAPQGFAEFMAVYGGLQAGLGVFFLLGALMPGLSRPAVIAGLCLYAGLVAWRSGAFLLHGRPSDGGIYWIYALEITLLLWSIAAAWEWRR